MEISLIDRRNETADIFTYRFRRPAGFVWTPGDYVDLALDLPDGGGDRRWMSIGSAPSEECLLFTTRQNTQSSPYKKALHTLSAGGKAVISPPIGNFNLPRQPEPVALIAGGIGVTAVRPMLVEPKPDWDITLIYLARPGEHIFKDVLNASGAKVVYLQDDGRTFGWSELTKALPDWSERMLYFCGPQPFAEGLHEAALAAGHPRPKLRLDYFEGLTEL